MTKPRALFINGTVGSGKTTVLDHVGDLLAEQQESFALLDLDWLRRSSPTPDGDPFNNAMELANLASVSANFRSAGMRSIILAGVLEDPDLRSRYAEAVGSELVVVRLQVDVKQIHARLRSRHNNPDEAETLGWHLHRAGELDAILESAAGEDFAILVGDESPRVVARMVLDAAGW